MKQPCDIIILAAGSSSRLGSPKQLLAFNQTNLLNNSIETALASVAQRVLVVLGANAQMLKSSIKNNQLHIVVNELWEEGIASSIRCGLTYLLAQIPAPKNILFMVCDQPYITTELIDKLITLQKPGKDIVASEYAGTAGIPAVFNKTLFPALLQLKGDAGAKKIIAQQKNKVLTVSFPLGDIDIDTVADYQDLQNKATRQHDH